MTLLNLYALTPPWFPLILHSFLRSGLIRQTLFANAVDILYAKAKFAAFFSNLEIIAVSFLWTRVNVRNFGFTREYKLGVQCEMQFTSPCNHGALIIFITLLFVLMIYH